MFERAYRALGSLIWRTSIALLVLVAVVVSLATALVPLLPAVNTSLVAEIESRTGFDAQVGGITAEMEGFRPKLALEDLNIRNKKTATSVFRAGRLQITINPWRSLLQRQLILAEMRASDVAIPARLTNEATGIVVPIDPSVFATEIERLALENMRVSLVRELSDTERVLELVVDLDLRREGSNRKLQLLATGDGGLTVSIVGSGVGNPLDLSRFAGSLRGRVSSDDIGLISEFFDADVSGTSDLLFWTDATAGQASTVFEVTGDALFPASDARLPSIAFSVNGSAMLDGNESWVNIAQAAVTLEQGPVQFNDIHVGLTTTDWELLVNDLDLASSAQLLMEAGLIPDSVREPLAAASISGTINALSLGGSLSGKSIERVAVDFDDIFVKEDTPLPGVSGLSGSLMLSGTAGQLQVNSSDLTLGIPTQYPNPMQLGNVNAVIDFDLIDDQVLIRSGRATARADDFEAVALLTGEIPLSPTSGRSPTLNVVLGSGRAPASRALAFTPMTIDPDAYRWMQTSLGTGQATQIGFILRGAVRKVDFPFRSIQLSALANLDAVTMMPGLPLAESLIGHVGIDNGLVTFDVDSALVGGLDISEGLVQVGKRDAIRMLAAQATIDGTLPVAIEQVAGIPYVPERVAKALRDLTVNGGVRGYFDLSMPIKGAAKIPAIATRVEVSEATVSVASPPITLQQVNGEFVYEYPRGIADGSLAARFENQDVLLDLNLDAAELGLSQKGLSIATSARLGGADVNRLLGVTVSDGLLEGNSAFDIVFQAGDGVALNVTSDLDGLAIGLPVPFSKAREQSEPLEMDLRISDAVSIDATYSNNLSLSIVQDGENAWRALASIGEVSSELTLDDVDTGTAVISGRVEELDISAWADTQARFNSGGDLGLPAIIWRDFSVDRLALGGAALGAFSSTGQYEGGLTSLGLVGDFIKAQIDFDGPEAQLDIQIDSLSIDSLPTLNTEALNIESDDPAAASWPAMKIAIDSLIFKGQDLGSLSFDASISKSSVDLAQFDGSLDGVTFGPESQFSWLRGDGSTTRASLDLTLPSAGEALTFLDAKSVVDFSSGRVLGKVEWPGAPTDFQANQVTGDLELQLTSGSFLPVPSQATDPLRFIGVFNLAGLVQRANVNQLFDPGLTFDRASGDFSLGRGDVTINEFAIRNGGGRLTLGGLYDMDSENIDAELVVTLPLVDNIPWVAALAGGLPIAAGAYLASKVFEDQMKSLSSGVYSVSGPVSSPEVKFVRVFDAKLSSNRDSGATEDQSSVEASESERK
ncbi:MAG: AsmA-like C-terminal region-containing protein [Halieaceae bacterium]